MNFNRRQKLAARRAALAANPLAAPVEPASVEALPVVEAPAEPASVEAPGPALGSPAWRRRERARLAAAPVAPEEPAAAPVAPEEPAAAPVAPEEPAAAPSKPARSKRARPKKGAADGA